MKKLLLPILFSLSLVLSFGQSTPVARYNTLAEMLAAPVPPNVNTRISALVTGRITANDGGGGTFFYDPASIATTNLGTIFKPSSSNGRWLRQYSGEVNVKWFGTVGDGVSDDTAAINAAKDVVKASGGGVLEFPTATYLISGDGIYATSDTEYRLNGSSFVVGTPVATTFVFNIDSSVETNLVYFSITGPATIQLNRSVAQTQYGFQINEQDSTHAVRNIAIRGVTVTNSYIDGFTIGGNVNAYPSFLLIENCTFDGNRRNGGSVTQADNWIIRGCTFRNTSGTSPQAGLDVEPNANLSVRNGLIEDCFFIGNTGNGCYVQRGLGVRTERVTVKNCYACGNGGQGFTFDTVEDCSNIGSYSWLNSSYGFLANGGTRLQYLDVNSFSNTLSGLILSRSYESTVQGQFWSNVQSGIVFATISDNRPGNTLASSYIHGNTLRGVILQESAGNTVSGNSIKMNGEEGVYITDSANNNVVSGNLIVGNGQSADNSVDQIFVRTESSYNDITGNTIRQADNYFSGTATAGGASTITLPAPSSTLDDAYNGMTIRTTGGTGSGQTRVVSDYVGATGVATVSVAWGTAPDNTTVFNISLANRPRRGITINSGTFQNRMVPNDLLNSGVTGTFLDLGTDTIKYFPIAEGGTSTDSLETLPGNVGAIGGSFLADNGRGLRVKSSLGSYVDLIMRDGSDNAYIETSNGGDFEVRPNGSTASKFSVNSIGNAFFRGTINLTNRPSIFNLGTGSGTNVVWRTGEGSPEGVVSGGIGSFYARMDGTTNTTLYYKVSDTGNTNWVAVADTGGAGAGTVTDVDANDILGFATGSVSNPTTTPVISYTPFDPGFDSIITWDDDAGTLTNALVVNGTYDSATGTWTFSGGGGGSGTVTNFQAGNLSPFFTTSETDTTTYPSLTFANSDPGFDSVHGWDDTEGAAKQLTLSGGSLDLVNADDALRLVGDSASPGNNYYYGTDGTGAKGWYELEGGGGGSPADTCYYEKTITSDAVFDVFTLTLNPGESFQAHISHSVAIDPGGANFGSAVGFTGITIYNDGGSISMTLSQETSASTIVGTVQDGGVTWTADIAGTTVTVHGEVPAGMVSESGTITYRVFMLSGQSISVSSGTTQEGNCGGSGGGSAPTGTIVNAVPTASISGSVPYFSNTTGTNQLPSSITISAATNLNVGSIVVTNLSNAIGQIPVVNSAGQLVNTPSVAYWTNRATGLFPFVTTALAMTTATTANAINVYLDYFPITRTITNIICNIQTADAAGLYSIAVFSADGTSRLIYTGTQSTASTGDRVITLGAPVTLPNGWYYVAFTCSSSSAIFTRYTTAGSMTSATLNAGNFIVCGNDSQTSASGVMPTSLATLSGSVNNDDLPKYTIFQ